MGGWKLELKRKIIENIKGPKMESVRFKSETQNLGDKKSGVRKKNLSHKTYILNRKSILEVNKNRTKLEFKSV